MADLFKNAETEITCTKCCVCTQFWPSAVVPMENGDIGIGWNWTQGFCNFKKKNVAGTSTCEQFELYANMQRKILLALNAGERVSILYDARLEATENRRKGKERDEKNSIVECDDGEIGSSVQPQSAGTLFD